MTDALSNTLNNIKIDNNDSNNTVNNNNNSINNTVNDNDINKQQQPFKIRYEEYTDERQLSLMTSLIEADLSEPYSIYTYRHFVCNYNDLSILAMKIDNSNNIDTLDESNYNSLSTECIGCIVCNIQNDRDNENTYGYIGMLAVNKLYRKQRIGSTLVNLVIDRMINKYNVDYVMLEAEYSNISAISLYENIGFVKDRRLYRYYLNGSDAYRLKLFVKDLYKNDRGYYAPSPVNNIQNASIK